MILENDKLKINVLPELGACLAQFSYKHHGKLIDIFRQADSNNPSLKNISFFMMGPWVARIPERKFLWQGKEITIEHPADPEKAIHGIFKQLPWQIETEAKDQITLILDFKNWDGGYTFVSDFKAKVTYEIKNSTLKLSLNLTNTGNSSMPFAMGSHPMILKRKSKAFVQFNAEKWFPPDPELLIPRGAMENIPAELNCPSSKEMPADWDHCLANWQGEAVISWPEEGLSLTLGKEDSYSTFLQCWSGQGRDVFALEQQTAPANAFNLLAQKINGHGVQIINPGEEITVIHTFTMSSI